MAWEHTPVSELDDDHAPVGGVRIEAVASPDAGAGPAPPEIPKTLVVTNDYPPRVGGVGGHPGDPQRGHWPQCQGDSVWWGEDGRHS